MEKIGKHKMRKMGNNQTNESENFISKTYKLKDKNKIIKYIKNEKKRQK